MFTFTPLDESTRASDYGAFNRVAGQLASAGNNVLNGTINIAMLNADDFTLAQHDHSDASNGGQVDVGELTAAGAADGHVATAIGGNVVMALNTAKVPAGIMEAYGGDTAPSGYLLCDGRPVNRQTYAALFAAIGVRHGAGDGTTSFNLPDGRGRVLMGLDNMGGTSANRVSNDMADTIGGSGGAEMHLLTEAELAVHRHAIVVSSSSSPGTNPGEDALYASGGRTLSRGANVANAHYPRYALAPAPRGEGYDEGGWPATNQGGTTGAGHNNMPPFLAINIIIKT